jgi:hypothetical protein
MISISVTVGAPRSALLDDDSGFSRALAAAIVPNSAAVFQPSHGNGSRFCALFRETTTGAIMGFGRGALLWLLGVPLPIIIILAIFMHH